MQAASSQRFEQQKVALVTGGTRGIGLGISRRLLREGYAVAILATRSEPSELTSELRALGELSYTQGSVADLDDQSRFVDDALRCFGRIDLLVNNAGVAPHPRADLLTATPESFDRVLTTNLRGPYFLTQKVATVMLGQSTDGKGERTTPIGTIVTISSISATTVSIDRGDYCISKAGLAMATQLWAARLAAQGIVVYEVRPGVIRTDMTAGVQQRYDSLFADGLAPVPRWGTPDDVAGAVVQLAAGAMPYSTGDVIHVDGGMHIARL